MKKKMWSFWESFGKGLFPSSGANEDEKEGNLGMKQ